MLLFKIENQKNSEFLKTKTSSRLQKETVKLFQNGAKRHIHQKNHASDY